jgi:hypothetical protein
VVFFRILGFWVIFGFSSYVEADPAFISPVSEDFWIHPGEGFCDKMYYHSYSARRYHTGVDYILKWKEAHIQTDVTLEYLLSKQKEFFGYVPQLSDFGNSEEKWKNFLKINVYRTVEEIVDTRLGLYPKTKDDLKYGFGMPVVAIYDGVVEEEVSPENPKGWGKAILIRHDAPRGKKFIVHWNGKKHRLSRVWSQYAHTQKNLFRVGDKVFKGDEVATIGDGNGIFQSKTGVVTIREGAHLHFEIRLIKNKLFPEKDVLIDKEKLQSIYIDPYYFLLNARVEK